MEYISFDKVCDVFSGYAFKKFNDLKEGKPVIKIGNIKANGEINTNTCTYTEETPLEKFNSKKDDLYVALSGATTGKVGLMEAEGFLINQRVGIVRRIIDYVPIKYIHFFMNSITDRILKDAVGAAQPNISPKDILKYKFPLRSKEEMEEITGILAEISTAIIKNKENIKALDELIKSQFIEMFGDVENCDNTVELQDVCLKITDGSHNPPAGIDISNNYMISSQNIHDNIIDYKDVRYLSDSDFQKEDKRTSIQLDDVLLTIVGAIGRSAIVKDDINITCQRSVCVIHPDKEQINSIFLKCMLDDLSERIINEARGVAQKGIYLNQVKKLQVICPSMELQNKFSDFVKQIDKSKFLIKRQIELLEELLNKKMDEYFK